MIGVVVEGATDRAAAESLLAARNLEVDPRRVVITGGKQRFDARLASYNRAAAHGSWLALRDVDRDALGCPVVLRGRLISERPPVPWSVPATGRTEHRRVVARRP